MPYPAPNHPRLAGDTDYGASQGLISFCKRESTLVRELYTARLARKTCISESAQCFHFDFVIDDRESFPFTSGQFLSAVATDPNGKQQTRAYSIASAANANTFRALRQSRS